MYLIVIFRRLTCFLFLLLIMGKAAAWEEPQEFGLLTIDFAVAKQVKVSTPSVPLLVHFHGDPQTTARNYREAEIPGVLVTVNCQGLSSAYRKPFRNKRLFAYLLEYTKDRLIEQGKVGPQVAWQRVDVSCFSAGYGAVREILKSPDLVQKIDGILAADSIYASIHRNEQGKRRVDLQQMEPFLNFAQLAVRGKKRFLLTHSQLAVEDYASTVETADYLLSELKITREAPQTEESTPMQLLSSAHVGSFGLRGFAGAEGESHLEHLRQISYFWKELAEMRLMAP